MTPGGPSFSVKELAQRVNGRLCGNGDARISGVNALDDAQPHEITFVADKRHARHWPASAAGAVVVSKTLSLESSVDDRPVITVDDAELAMITLLELFALPPDGPDIGVHESAVVDPTATIGHDVRIGPHVSVGRRCVIGDGVTLHAGVRVHSDVRIGDGTTIHSNCVIRERCTIGRGVTLHQNVSIGADGFGYRPAPDGRGLLKVPQIGTVVIEDDVEMGACCCVDRAKFGATVIGAGTKMDDLVMIGHNCRVGRCCIIVSMTGLAGGVQVGDGVIIGGQVAVQEHTKIGPGARIGAKSGVMSDIPAGQTWIGAPAGPATETLRQWAALRKLPDLLRGLSDRSGATAPVRTGDSSRKSDATGTPLTQHPAEQAD